MCRPPEVKENERPNLGLTAIGNRQSEKEEVKSGAFIQEMLCSNRCWQGQGV